MKRILQDEVKMKLTISTLILASTVAVFGSPTDVAPRDVCPCTNPVLGTYCGHTSPYWTPCERNCEFLVQCDGYEWTFAGFYPNCAGVPFPYDPNPIPQFPIDPVVYQHNGTQGCY
ncbi:hypothetical protein F5B21DRAFT_457022 [Xylaria acuta]|nr:hypothetical protein F5B21DRAFT_457022 [Xylaria acuta]